MTKKPRILITNDDGVDAPGIKVLEQIARQISDDVWVVAPLTNQSGVGHKFTLGQELKIEQRDERIYAVNGSPADCVVTGMTHLLKKKPADIVLSGVNRGQNIADLVNCSGTAAGAREGALQGALGIALSQSMDFSNEHLIEWDCSKAYGAQVVEQIIKSARGTETYYNINFPRCTADEVSGIEVVPHQRFSTSPFEYYPSDNAGKHFVAILETPKPLTPEADCVRLLDHNAITVTPLLLQQTDMTELERLSGTLQFSKVSRDEG
ncbi:5'/3'-nucleotidase SurE [Maritalea mediterranea]|uniref:5'-nucleotidase SurE n=1 Tax=Maritalea mediterranea TaxID=2909667 RepID=A0ABS9E5Y2_9HYPH|nr:5'/3'-nucleotidase SurE [Maritalea mediterranea]MCF4098285.1 5'/3'-nucleotidase SurE [Maritalea mediterranea]